MPPAEPGEHVLRRLGPLLAAAMILPMYLLTASTPDPFTPTPAAAMAHAAAVEAIAPVSARPAPVPSTVTVHAGDTYSGWAVAYCGSFDAWHLIASVNGWPERAIPVGVTARIVCGPGGQPAAAPAKPATPPAGAWVHPLASGKHGNSCYGWRASTGSFHGGVDMAQPWGTPIRAVAAGTVYLKRYQPGGAGYYVVIKHAGGVFTLYAHMPAPSPLDVGAVVAAGQQIGRVGATGNATGPHLHFEVQTGGYGNTHRTNPAVFMRGHGVDIGC